MYLLACLLLCVCLYVDLPASCIDLSVYNYACLPLGLPALLPIQEPLATWLARVQASLPASALTDGIGQAEIRNE